MEQMKSRGIQTSIHYPPIHQFTAYRSQSNNLSSLPSTEEIAARELTLPLYPGLSASDVRLVVEAARDALLKV